MSNVTHEPDLLFLLHDLGRQIRIEADRRASAHGMTRTQWVLLVRLEQQPGLSQKELAELLEVEPITVARLIDRLEDRGMVQRQGDPTDRRIWRLYLCPAALPVLEALHAERMDMLRMVTANLDPATVKTLEKGLARMKSNIIAGAPKSSERDIA
jgi:MarR family transcriptional regulator, transcriptional regulator for hemolysin